jgi:hypothetical protein
LPAPALPARRNLVLISSFDTPPASRLVLHLHLQYETVDLQHDPGRYSPRTVEAAIEAVGAHQAKACQAGRTGKDSDGSTHESGGSTQGPADSTQGPGGSTGGYDDCTDYPGTTDAPAAAAQTPGANMNGGMAVTTAAAAAVGSTSQVRPYTLTGSLGHNAGRLSSSGSLDGGRTTSGGESCCCK